MKWHDVELIDDYMSKRLDANRICVQVRKRLISENVQACTCEKCLQTFPISFIDIHHINPIGEGGDSDGEVITVCRKCHYALHDKVYDPKTVYIDIDEWKQFARDNMKFKDIAVLYDCRTHNIEKAWQSMDIGMSWSAFKKSVRKEV